MVDYGLECFGVMWLSVAVILCNIVYSAIAKMYYYKNSINNNTKLQKLQNQL